MPAKPVQPLFLRTPAAGLRLVIFALLSLVLMMLDHRTHQLDELRGLLTTMAYPLQYGVDLPIQTGRWVMENLASRHALVKENAALRRQQFLLRAQMEKYADLEAENRRLRGLLNSSQRLGERVLIAELLAVDMDPFSRRIVLSKGSRDQVTVGQALIDANGIIGQVVEVGMFSSAALLITDPSHAIPVQIIRNGLRSIAVGTGSLNLLELSYVPNNADVVVGDLMVTSGLGGKFPAGYPVGKVLSVERDTGQPFARVLIEPSALLERNREVLLIWGAETIPSLKMPPEALSSALLDTKTAVP